MKRLDFINLITTYASHFREIDAKKSVDKTLTDFINFVAANQGIDYGIYVEELTKHKKRKYNPVDSDVIINMSQKICDLEDVLKTIYMNSDHPMVKFTIENVADKHGGELQRTINLHKD
jgi:hypothetical protein